LKPVKQSDLLAAFLSALGGTVADAPAAKPANNEWAARSLRVLLAEDNVVNQRLATRLLEKRGHSVLLAENGIAALALLDQQTVDLILMDLQMPKMDGVEATTAIRQRERGLGTHTPIIAMTAYAMASDRDRCLEAGMDAYLSKPVRAEELYRLIDRIAAESPKTAC
jgi:CheY-like chemotaxis protein